MDSASRQIVSEKTVKRVSSRQNPDEDTKEKNRGHKGKSTRYGKKTSHRRAVSEITHENSASSSDSALCVQVLRRSVGRLCLFIRRRLECSLCVPCFLCV